VLFSSSVFLLAFLPAVLLIYYFLLRQRRHAQNLFLLLSSLFFYAWGEPRFVLVMLASILGNFFLGKWVWRWKRLCRRLTLPVAIAVACNLGVLFLFKYLDFTLETINLFGLNLPLTGITLPIGISFFTFQALSYVLDVAMGKAQVQRSPLALGLYVSFFPQLIAGPIVKYADVAWQIGKRRESWDSFSQGTTRFLTGFAKKVLIANQMAAVADRVFSLDAGNLSAPLAWLGSICYSFQIYYDFSGYSDMAIGLGLMFGFQFRENFRHPYAARSVTDFWRRWHISLSTWFRDYVYIPLGGNRAGRRTQARNLFVVWLLTGLWHGANWTFIAWGLFYFALLCLEKFSPWPRRCPALLYRAFTLLMVNFLWMLFRCDSLSHAGAYLSAMLGAGGTAEQTGQCVLYLRENAVILLCAALFATPAAQKLKAAVDALRGKKLDLSLVWDTAYALGLTALAAMSVSCLVKGTYNPFIYFNF